MNAYAMALRNLEREREMPEMLAEDALTPLQGQMVSGHYVNPSWTQGLDKLARAYMARKGLAQNDQKTTDLVEGRQKALVDALRGNAPPELLRKPGYEEAPLSQRIGAVDPEMGIQLQVDEARRAQSLDDQKALIDYRRTSGANKPANIAEWEAFQAMSPEDQESYLLMKRANPYLNLGGEMVQPSITQPGVVRGGFGKTLPPQDLPEVRAAQAAATTGAQKAAESAAEVRSDLSEREAGLPRLEELVTELSDLGKKATYTKAGQAWDAVKRQTGLPVGEGAIARAEYIATVDNEVLPLLRQTFGAAFTEKEGERLKATLGDPNKSPEEKDAVLRAFIATKRAQIETAQRRSGNPILPSSGFERSPAQGGMKFLGFE